MVRRTFVFVAVLTFALLAPAAFAGELEIHVINVHNGCSILVRGPNGTTILMDAGDRFRGKDFVKPYLESIGITPKDGLDYTIAGHLDADHVGGFDEVLGKGNGKYDVHVKNYYSGSTNCTRDECQNWRKAAKKTTAKSPVVMQIGTRIELGDGATLTCVARNGRIVGGKTVIIPKKDENDRSIVALIQYGGFDYLWAGDLGGVRTSKQVDMETPVINAMLAGPHPFIREGGIDVLHVSHHGSATSTNETFVTHAAPAVAIISTGDGQKPNYHFPRTVVVDEVLGGNKPGAGPLILQTDEGAPMPESTSAFSVGDITIRTNGKKTFTVDADGAITVNEVAKAKLPRTFPIDETREP